MLWRSSLNVTGENVDWCHNTLQLAKFYVMGDNFNVMTASKLNDRPEYAHDKFV